MAVNVRKGTQRAGDIQQWGTFICTVSMQSMNGDRGQDTSKNLQPISIYYVHALTTILLTDKAPQTFMQNPRKEEQARKPLLLSESG